MMKVVFAEKALEDCEFFRENNPKIFEKIRLLIANIQEMPFSGLGKPEALKYDWKGCWSRRITKEHRLIYKIEEEQIIVFQARFHY